MKISAFFIVTEPEKMGFPYLESIEAASKFSDEIVVVCGRNEEAMEALQQLFKAASVRDPRMRTKDERFEELLMDSNSVNIERISFGFVSQF